MAKRVKTKAEVEEKMKDRVTTAGKYLKAAIEKAEDPIEVILADPEAFIKRMVENLTQAYKEGKIKSGFEKAKKRNAWKNAKDRAGSHYEERSEDMVTYALSDYDARKQCIEKARTAIKDMPTTTRAQRIERSRKYQQLVGECFDELYGRKG